MIEAPVDVIIERVQVEGPSAYATVRFRNRGGEVVRLDPYNLCRDGVLEAPVFRLTGPDGAELPYRGRLYKRGAPDFERFEPLNPGEALEVTCLLNSGYPVESLAGQGGQATLSYSVYNMAPEGEYFALESPPVRFDPPSGD